MCTQCNHIADAMPDAKLKAAKRLPKAVISTHEELVARVHALAMQRSTLTKEDRVLLKNIKLTYGSGPDGTRGVTYYKLWQKGSTTKGSEPNFMPFVAICATGQSDHIQLIGTTLHELGHVIAGMGAAHGPLWLAACKRLGLVGIQAAGTQYAPENFEQGPQTLDGIAIDWRKAMLALPKPKDGAPVNSFVGMAGGLNLPGVPMFKLKPCTFGRGSRGGKSRGTGSGSRQLKYTCGCTIVRAARGAGFEAKCTKCGNDFALDNSSVPPSQTPPEGPQAGKAKAKGKASAKAKTAASGKPAKSASKAKASGIDPQ